MQQKFLLVHDIMQIETDKHFTIFDYQYQTNAFYNFLVSISNKQCNIKMNYLIILLEKQL